MYTIIRLIISCIFLVCLITVVRKSQVIHKRTWYLVFTSLAVILSVALAFFPFENLFITFNSPKAAYEYFNAGKSNIELIVEGNDCDFIVDHKGDSDRYLIIPKTEDGWKIGIGSDTKKIDQKLSNGIVVDVYQYKNTNDYFITILDSNGGQSTVSDEYNTEFLSIERNDAFLGKTFVTYYAHITNFDSQYSVIVNGDKIVLGNKTGVGSAS